MGGKRRKSSFSTKRETPNEIVQGALAHLTSSFGEKILTQPVSEKVKQLSSHSAHLRVPDDPLPMELKGSLPPLEQIEKELGFDG